MVLHGAAEPDATPILSVGRRGGRKRHHLASCFIPECETGRVQGIFQGERPNLIRPGHQNIVAGLKVIIGYARQQVMDMMEADIAREPLQDWGQLEI